MTPIFKGTVEIGRVLPADPVRFAAHLRSMEGSEVEVIVRKHRKKRSNPQNSYLHKCLALWADDLGYELEDLKDVLKARFLTHYPEGCKLPKIKRTRDLNTAEMAEFTEQIKRLAAEHGFRIPDPGEVEYA